MDHDYKQAHKSGETPYGPQPEGPERKEIIDILQSGLSSNGWTIIENDTTKQPFKFVVGAHNQQLSVFIYCWRISNGGRKRVNEQRIQIGSADKTAFHINNSNPDQKGLLLGIYRSSELGTEPILVAWETANNKDHGASKSCFITIESIAHAMRDGFIQARDSDNNLICAFRKEFLNFYILNLNSLHSTSFSEASTLPYQETTTINETTEEYQIGNLTPLKGENRIIYGAPGTGKSHLLDRQYKNNFNRITFHPEYTYHDFVGSLRPKMQETGINYMFSPGPFIAILKKALTDPHNLYTLIIEEINRANTAAVFGDIFQLLDRNESGESEYPIINADLIDCLNSGTDLNLHNITIPSNLNIVATMNSADQGVFLMDSAFKRRWGFEYMRIDFSKAKHADFLVPYKSGQITWRNLIESINTKLADLEINEDKHVGPYFMKSSEVSIKDKIASKLLIYLWDDVVRHNRNELFDVENFKTFSEISDAYMNGLEIFHPEVINPRFYIISSDSDE